MLIFDFDGVLINSLDEVVLTTYNAAAGSLCTSLTQVPVDLLQMFKNNRFHVQPIGDAIALMNWCLANRQGDLNKILTPEEYGTIADGTDIPLTDRTNLIYDTRQRFIDRDTKRWLDLHQPCQPLWNKLIGRTNFPFVILTNKNHDATLRLCRHFGLNIDAKDIYSGDNGVTKIENMLRIQERFGQFQFSFIDDSVKNLKELDLYFNAKNKTLTLLLATWGYTGAQDERIARKSGYPALQQTDVVRLLDISNSNHLV
jgi:phosphoglycolate phosphatase-like HAD superfamily hydrolase